MHSCLYFQSSLQHCFTFTMHSYYWTLWRTTVSSSLLLLLKHTVFFRWPLYQQMDDLLGAAAASIGIERSCEQRAAPAPAASHSSDSINTSAPAVVSPTEQLQPCTSDIKPRPTKRQRQRDQAPAWFQNYIQDQRQWQESFREERRQQFAVLERQNNERWTEGATYIRQGGHHVGHWPTRGPSHHKVMFRLLQELSADDLLHRHSPVATESGSVCDAFAVRT